MYRVTTENLAHDASTAGAAYETADLGEMETPELTTLLETFLRLDPIENQEHDPHLVVSRRSLKLLIRTGGGRLLVYEARDQSVPAVEMTIPELLAALERSPGPTASPFTRKEPELPTPSAPHRSIAIAMLAVGLALNGYTLYSVFYIQDVNKKPAVTLITEPAEVASRMRTVVGTFATGNRVGDRVIVVNANGTLRFYENGASAHINDSSDSYRLGRHDGQLCLATPESGLVDVTGNDTLVYYRDVYQRTH